jgi:ABC-type polysaccharide/polyol phosphate export permease
MELSLIRSAYAVNFYRFIRDVMRNRRLLIDLIKNDFKSRYLNNYLALFLILLIADLMP